MKRYKSFAKINLSLEVISQRDNGYHNIDTIMHKIDLHDQMTFTQREDSNIYIHSDNEDLPKDESNLIYKAWKIMSQFKQEQNGIDISVTKNIPIASGLGGGTSNGVLTMNVLNEIWDLNLSGPELISLAKPLGADSTFFFYDDLVRAIGIGEEIIDILEIPKYPILLVNIGKPLSSGHVYEQVSQYSSGKVEKIMDYIHNYVELPKLAYNNLEEVSFEIYPELRSIKSQLEDTGPKFAAMSGAGPTMFALYDNVDQRDAAYELLKDKYKIVIKSRLV